MKIFITGGSGFLGQSIIKQFIKEKHHVNALSRSVKSDELLTSLGASSLRGDLLDISSFSNSLEGHDLVIHCGAPVKFWGPWSDFEEGIVRASTDLAKAAEAANIKKFIHISSESVLQNGKALIDVDETTPYPETISSFYGKAKMLAEKNLKRISGEMDIIILRPPFIYGEGCHAYKELFESVESGLFKWVNGANHPMEAIHVENLAEAIKLAALKDIKKGIYYVTDSEKLSARDFFTKLFEDNGVTVPEKSVPHKILKPIAWILTKIWATLGIRSKPPITLFDLEFISLPRRYKIEKFRKATGLEPTVKFCKKYLSI